MYPYGEEKRTSNIKFSNSADYDDIESELTSQFTEDLYYLHNHENHNKFVQHVLQKGIQGVILFENKLQTPDFFKVLSMDSRFKD